jgi:hypothetical protein
VNTAQIIFALDAQIARLQQARPLVADGLTAPKRHTLSAKARAKDHGCSKNALSQIEEALACRMIRFVSINMSLIVMPIQHNSPPCSVTKVASIAETSPISPMSLSR